ncbi:MAG: ABC transporter permease [Candidatus Brocadiaceae bacterium]|nr:ABC transporter permease [Candidatus Brocadiaceae bacterium]
MSENQVYISSERITMVGRFREIIKVRELLWNLTLRDLKVRYKQSVLGIAWAMFIPLSQMLVFTFIVNRGIIPINTDLPYAVFVYCGLLPWQFFSTSTNAAVNSLVANQSLVTKIYMPAEVFPISNILASFVDFLVGSVILVGLMVYFSMTGNPVVISWTVLFVFPIILVQMVFSLGLGFFLAMGNLFFRDIRYVFTVVIMLWMFASSVIYPMKTSDPTIQMLLNLNPMTPILNAYRDVLLRGILPDWGTFGYSALVATVLFFAGWTVFYKMQYIFAEKV